MYFQKESAHLIGYVLFLERHLADLERRRAACPFRDMDASGCREDGKEEPCLEIEKDT